MTTTESQPKYLLASRGARSEFLHYYLHDASARAIRYEGRLLIFEEFEKALKNGRETYLDNAATFYQDYAAVITPNITRFNEFFAKDVEVAKNFATNKIEIAGKNVGIDWLIAEERKLLSSVRSEIIRLTTRVVKEEHLSPDFVSVDIPAPRLIARWKVKGRWLCLVQSYHSDTANNVSDFTKVCNNETVVVFFADDPRNRQTECAKCKENFTVNLNILRAEDKGIYYTYMESRLQSRA